MKLTEAFRIIREPNNEPGQPVDIFLACGFTPLHLETFLVAHLKRSIPAAKPAIKSGLFEDLAGNIKRLAGSNFETGVIMIEWQDLDPRLGIRHLGGWKPEDIKDIVKCVKEQIGSLETAILSCPTTCSVVISLPTLPIPPISYQPKSEIDFLKRHLSESITLLVNHLGEKINLKILDSLNLEGLPSIRRRLDVKNTLETGFPYSLEHASALAQAVIQSLFPPIAKKGIIVDLDDTLWKGTLGEDGILGISWDLDNHSHHHGLFQQFLSSLADSGILIGVATRNDLNRVQEAFHRPDLIIDKDILFPVEANWGPKSLSVSRILQKWNISDDSVIFVDDSPLEVAEVQAAFPHMECRQYPTNNNQAVYNLIIELREKFAKESISIEDGLRLTSIKVNSEIFKSTDHKGTKSDSFLKQVDGRISFSFSKILPNNREIELINKTNQFNLNGKRISRNAWNNMLEDSREYLLSVTYDDKFGPLGKIAVLTGRQEQQSLSIDYWVMSCRAFNRDIEYTCLDILFRKFEVSEIWLKYQATPKNQPIQEFIQNCTEIDNEDYIRLTQANFLANSPNLFHKTTEINHE